MKVQLWIQQPKDGRMDGRDADAALLYYPSWIVIHVDFDRLQRDAIVPDQDCFRTFISEIYILLTCQSNHQDTRDENTPDLLLGT